MRVVVGRIGRALGVKGDLLIEVRTDEPDRRFVPGGALYVGDSDRVLWVASARDHSGRLCLHFDGIDDRTAAEQLTGLLLEVERDPAERPEDPDEYFDDQLLGLEVRTLDGVGHGLVHEVLHLPAQDVLAVRRPDGTEFLVPFVEAMVPSVDLAGGFVTIDPPAGLLSEADGDEGGEDSTTVDEPT